MSLNSSDTPIDPSKQATISESDRHRILSSRRRRVLLEFLADEPTPIDVEPLAAAIGERDGRTEVSPTSEIERIAISLHHVDLPMIDEAGLVEYDPETSSVTSVRGLSSR